MRAVPAMTQPMWLGYTELVEAAEESVRRDRGSLDPRKFYQLERLGRPADWYIAVLGHAAPMRNRTLTELHMLLIAHERDLDPPLPQWLVESRANLEAEDARRKRQARQAQEELDAQWRALWQRLPFSIEVAYNYCSRTLEFYTQGADHIVVGEDVRFGRLRRAAGDALCTVDSNRSRQQFDNPESPEIRRSTCRTCLNHAARMAGGMEIDLLLKASRGRGR